MNSIGGYFELELRKEEEYHKDAIRLNSGRNAFEYILRAREYKKVYLPHYTCDVLLDTIKKLKLDYELYHINKKLQPLVDFKRIRTDEAVLYSNYFGIAGHEVKRLSKSIPNLIVDNSQAFFESPFKGIDTFYSPRKFFGVPDGAYLYTNHNLAIKLEKDNSLGRFGHLLGRIENNAEESYYLFTQNDKSLTDQPIKSMSNITQCLLKNIDYKIIAKKRKENFDYLHRALGALNLFEIDDDDDSIPLIYPFLSYNEDLRNYLIQNKIFIAQYWPNVLEWCDKNDLEYNFAKYILPLPIDQRYGENEMKLIISIIKCYGKI
jgi:hypothetical protein